MRNLCTVHWFKGYSFGVLCREHPAGSKCTTTHPLPLSRNICDFYATLLHSSMNILQQNGTSWLQVAFTMLKISHLLGQISFIHAFKDAGLFPFNLTHITARVEEEERKSEEAKTGLISEIVANILNCDAKRQETHHDNILSILQNNSPHESVCFDLSPLRTLSCANSLFLSPACENNVCHINPGTQCSYDDCTKIPKL